MREPVTLAADASWDGIEVSGSFVGAVASHVDISGCRLTRAVFTGAEIDRLRLADTVVEDCEFSGAFLSRLSAVRVEFRRCRMSGLDARGGDFRDVRFSDCKLDGANFRMTTWERSAFEGCLLGDGDFGSAKLPGIRLRRCDLSGADFSKPAPSPIRPRGSKRVHPGPGNPGPLHTLRATVPATAHKHPRSAKGAEGSLSNKSAAGYRPRDANGSFAHGTPVPWPPVPARKPRHPRRQQR